MVYEESKIIRRDRLKTVTVGSDIKEDANALEILQVLNHGFDEYSKDFDLGYYYEFGGEFEVSGKANDSIVVNLPIAFYGNFLMMVAQFNSVRKPFDYFNSNSFGNNWSFIWIVYYKLIFWFYDTFRNHFTFRNCYK